MQHVHLLGLLLCLFFGKLVEERRCQEACVDQVLTDRLLILELGGTLWRFEIDARSRYEIKVGLKWAPFANPPELLRPLVLELSNKHLGSS